MGERPEAEILRWEVPRSLFESPSIRARDVFAARLESVPVQDAVWTFCKCDLKRLVKAGLRMIGEPRGVGIELGSGCGLLGALVARSCGVETIYAIDPSAGMHRLVANRVALMVLGAAANKIVRVVGSFDQIQLADASVDFALNFHSLHHSDDLTRTLLEVARVLKPGGWVLSFDRVQPDSMTDAEIDRSLSKMYDGAYLERNGYPAGTILSRRENGEHQIRLREWRGAFTAAGLEITRLMPSKEAVTFRMAVKGVLSLLPRFVTRNLYRDPHANWRHATQSLRYLIDRGSHRYLYFRRGERNSTLIVARKIQDSCTNNRHARA